MTDHKDKSFMEVIANARKVVDQFDPEVFGPLLQQLDEAESEKDALIVSLQINIAASYELQKQYAALRRGEFD